MLYSQRQYVIHLNSVQLLKFTTIIQQTIFQIFQIKLEHNHRMSLEHGETIYKYNPVYVTKPTPQGPVKEVTGEVYTRIRWYIRTFERAFKY